MPENVARTAHHHRSIVRRKTIKPRIKICARFWRILGTAPPTAMTRTTQRLTPRRVALGASGARHAIGLNQARRLVGQNRSGGQMNLRIALLAAAVIGCANAAQAACRDDL